MAVSIRRLAPMEKSQLISVALMLPEVSRFSPMVIVVAGACNPSPSDASSLSLCLARYQGGPNEARICTLDIDGDNRVLATTDALIYTRISLGMSGSSVLAGNHVREPCNSQQLASDSRLPVTQWHDCCPG